MTQSMSHILSNLRCPDCLGNALVADAEVRDSNGMRGRFTCGDCGRELRVENGILDALPHGLGQDVRANLDLYDAMAAEEASVLAARARTRNHRNKMDMIRRALGIDEGADAATIIEFGVGYGAHGAELVEAGHTYCGLDISPGLLRAAKQRFPILAPTVFLAADATRAPCRDKTFDRVFCVAMLHHLATPERGLREMVRVLTPGGRFAILEPRRFYPTTLLQWARHRETEVSVMKVHAAAVARWLEQSGVRGFETAYCVFTPNGPRFLTGFFDAVDSLFERASILRCFSVMFCVYGEK